MNVNKEIVVCYLFTKFDQLNDIVHFIKNYSSFKSGLNHSLVVCLKLTDQTNKAYIIKNLNKNNIKFTLLIDTSTDNDFDFGSYYRVAKKYSDSLIFYLNASSKPISNNWLRLLVNNYEENSLIGTTASYESHFNNVKFKKIYKFFTYILRKFIYVISFKPFPNPHIRTTGFLLSAKNYLDFYKNENCKNKYDAWKIESGRNSLTSYFLKNNFPIKLVNSEGSSFNIKNWPNSNTYCYLNRSKLIVSDKHTRKYDDLNNNEKILYQKKVWGM